MTIGFVFLVSAMTVSALLFGVALVRGTGPERLLAGTLFVSGLLEAFILWLGPSLKESVQEGMCLLLDLVLFAMILAIALRANRLYPLWLGGLQLVTLACHLADLSVMSGAKANAAMQWVPFCAQLMVMMWGLFANTTSRRRDPSWTT